MGRYSVLLSPQLADLAGVAPGRRVLDVGCGPGALTAELVGTRLEPRCPAVDPSESFVAAAGSAIRASTSGRRPPRAPVPGRDIRRCSRPTRRPFHVRSRPGTRGDEASDAAEAGWSLPASWDHAAVRTGLEPDVGGGAEARPGCRRRVATRRRPQRRSREACSSGRVARRRGDCAVPSASSTRPSRNGGSRSPSASVLWGHTSRGSTRPAGRSCGRPVGPPSRRSHCTLTARAWTARGFV